MDKKAFFDSIRKSLFNGRLAQSQVKGIEGILQAMDEVGDGDQDTLAYALATAFHEVGGRMVPIREGFAKTDAGARKAVNALAAKRGPKSAVAKYAKPAGPYGHVYYARGHMGMTWLDNYEKSSVDAGVDLVANPDAMLDPVISARVLIKGIIDGRWNGKGHGIDYYEGADDVLSDAEAEEARRLVNVQDKARLIAGYHRKFYSALELAGWQPVDKAKATAKPVVPATAPKRPAPAPKAKKEPVVQFQKPRGVVPWIVGIVVGGYVTAAAWYNDNLAPVVDWLFFWQ